MSKKSDLKDLANKFNLSKIMNNIAEVVDSGLKISDVDPSDAIGKKIADIDALVKAMHQTQKEHANNLAKVDQLLEDLFADLQRLREQSKPAGESAADAAKAEATTRDTADAQTSEPSAEPDNASSEAAVADTDDKTDKAE